VDLDLCLFLLDEAAEQVRVADLQEERLRALSGDAARLAFLAAPGPLERGLLVPAAEAAFPAGAPLPEGAAAASSRDLARAASRVKQAADLLRRRGAEAAILDPEGGAAARLAADRAAERAGEAAKALEEEGKRAEGREGGFAPPLGRDGFVSILRARHGVEEDPEAIEAWGLELLARTRGELEELAAAEFPGRTWEEALDGIRLDHATPAELPGEARRAAEEARDFCIARGLVTIPPAARLGHVDLVNDEMARSYPFAAYSWRLATAEGESGRYLVSPGATWMSPEQREERLRGNCRAWTRVVAAHETWPGHHLQFWVADRECSPLRREAGTPVFVEGWGLYCEWLLERHGHFRTPAERLAVLAMRAWRACRVVLDVRLHCGGCTPAEAVEFLAANAHTTRDAAGAEVKRYMTSPGQPFTYAWGCREILGLRAAEEARLGARFDERDFHDRLLRCGPVPFRFVRRLLAPAEGGGDADSIIR
jgi:uncharacterized protein (DUF885 family)